MKTQENSKKPRFRRNAALVDGTGLEFKEKHLLQQIALNSVAKHSEMIEHGISQSSCFIEDGPLKGQNKGRSQNVRKEYHAMEITYTNHKGFSLPNLTLPRKEEASFGRYGHLRLKYLKEHRRVLYINLLTSGELTQHLSEIDRQAREMLELLVKQMRRRRAFPSN